MAAATINATMAILHQGKYKQAARLSKAIKIMEIKNFICCWLNCFIVDLFYCWIVFYFLICTFALIFTKTHLPLYFFTVHFFFGHHPQIIIFSLHPLVYKIIIEPAARVTALPAGIYAVGLCFSS